jgi:hypothetical protein
MDKLAKRLSDRFVKSAKPGFHHDGDGLYLQVTSATARSWIYRRRLRVAPSRTHGWIFPFTLAGKTRDAGQGSHPTIGLATPGCFRVQGLTACRAAPMSRSD